MDNWQQTRVITAAQFLGRSLLVHVATLRRGTSVLLHLRVGPRQEDASEAQQWRFGDRSADRPVPPVSSEPYYDPWEDEWVDPSEDEDDSDLLPSDPDADLWEEFTFSGPLPMSATSDSLQPCLICGAAPVDDANHCSHCGSPLDAAEAVAAALAGRIGDNTAGSATAGASLAALIDRYTENSLPPSQDRAELLRFIEADFTESASARFIRGEPATATPDLTLAVAQDIHQTVAATGRVGPDQVQHAELLLRFAPLRYGYWGPFKALVKSMPVEDLPAAYADALARLSSTDWSRPAPPPVGVEDASLLGDIFPEMSSNTLKYLARRVRRDLATLAKKSPDTYARVAARMILSWDRSLSRNAFAPAYVMLGARSPLDKQGANVVLDPDMSTRRDAHPDIWNERPQLVQEIFDNIKNSVEAQTWAYQVLDSLGAAPAIAGHQLQLAFQSSFQPLSLAGSAALSIRPGSWGSITAAEWMGYFRHGDESSIAGILEKMLTGTVRPAAVEAARGLISAGVSGVKPRLLQIAVFYLAVTQASKHPRTILEARAEVAAVTTVLRQSATKNKKLWSPILNRLNVADLTRVRQAVRDDAPRSVLKTIDDLILRRKAEKAQPWEAIDWIASKNPLESKLGWQILGKSYGISHLLELLAQWTSTRRWDPRAVERIIPEVIARSYVTYVPELSEFIQEAVKIGVDGANLLAFLTQIPLGRAVIWHIISTPAGRDFASLLNATPDGVRLTGDDIQADQLASATTDQCHFVLQYITENRGRIAEDVAFGVAAATSSTPALQVQSIKQLRTSGHLPQIWLSLAGSVAPRARKAAREYVAGLTDGRQFRDAVLKCLDNESSAVRDIGTQVLRVRMERSEDRSLWTALAESEDWRILDVVAADTHIADRVDPTVLSAFDRRVLTTRRRCSRRAKESVKARLEATNVDSLATQERISAFLDLVRGQILQDREWALEILAELALNGVAIDGLEISLVTTGESS